MSLTRRRAAEKAAEMEVAHLRRQRRERGCQGLDRRRYGVRRRGIGWQVVER